jgi:DNA-binding CsgD family transcriptional regulator
VSLVLVSLDSFYENEQSLFHIETMKNEPLDTAVWRSRPPPWGGHPEKAQHRIFAPDDNGQPAVPIGLSPRERQVMEPLAQGLLYKEIAGRMNVSHSAVHKLQHKIFVKLRVGNRTEAVVKWTAWCKIPGIRTSDKVAPEHVLRAHLINAQRESSSPSPPLEEKVGERRPFLRAVYEMRSR